MPDFKKIFLAIAVFLVLLVGYFSFSKNNKFYEFEINGKTYKLLTAKTQSEWTKGLMDIKNKKDLKGADGMIFIFPNKNFREFWNQNTYLDLDIYWLDGEKVVGSDRLPSIEKSKDIVVVYSPFKVDKVVEIVR